MISCIVVAGSRLRGTAPPPAAPLSIDVPVGLLGEEEGFSAADALVAVRQLKQRAVEAVKRSGWSSADGSRPRVLLLGAE
jgi:hypothetical protein